MGENMKRGDVLLLLLAMCALTGAIIFAIIQIDAPAPATSDDVSDVGDTSEANQEVLTTLEGGVDAIEQGYACLVAILFVPEEHRAAIPGPTLERVCGVNPAQVALLLQALEVPVTVTLPSPD